MGKQDRQEPLFAYNVSLDERVRADNPLRRVHEAIDFSFVREEVAGFYGWKGNESVDPEVIMRMMFLLFFDNVPSERQLMATIPERLDYMWRLGYGLDDEIPNHSVLSKARRRWGPEVFENLFERTAPRCVEAGLVDGSKLHFDDATNNHGFKRARWRRLWRQRIQNLMIAACQNVRILLARGKAGPTAQGQKLAPAPPTAPLTPPGGFIPRFFVWLTRDCRLTRDCSFRSLWFIFYSWFCPGDFETA